MDYKLSRFNVFLEKNGRYFVSNTFSHSIIELNGDEYEMLSTQKLDFFSSDSIDVFYREGICVEKDLDEIGLLRYAYNNAKNTADYMEFVVAPTLDCNFACPYCFETKRHHYMHADMRDKVIGFYEEQVALSAYKKVKFAWYGGEPLIRFDIIKEMTEKAIRINEKYNVTCDIVMTTNGYLLNSEIKEELERLGFRYIQITIDGTKEIHDSRRILLSGEGTFDRIIGNIKLFKNSEVEISVRVNIDKENVDAYQMVSKLVKGLGMDNVKVYPALVEFTENQESCRECKCMTAEEFGEFASTAARDYYFNDNGFACSNISVNCGAEHIHSFVIDDYGDVYKCWNTVGYEKEKLFNLDDRKTNPVVAAK